MATARLSGSNGSVPHGPATDPVRSRTADVPACPAPHCHELRQRGDPPRYYAPGRMLHVPEATHRCEGCGGLWTGREWIYRCSKCRATVAPGELRGCFVHHLCIPCDRQIIDAERAAGHICSTCRNVLSYCYC